MRKINDDPFRQTPESAAHGKDAWVLLFKEIVISVNEEHLIFSTFSSCNGARITQAITRARLTVASRMVFTSRTALANLSGGAGRGGAAARHARNVHTVGQTGGSRHGLWIRALIGIDSIIVDRAVTESTLNLIFGIKT